ncbi:alkaline phosphatase D family protein [Aquimarina mytili]|uniref:Alkaline phosphatase family protein n=1 Tax=Aquimarina mytili TaxID=874423 RepID=A0A936ZYG9_9FLAO|nr:alkaline phosphatase D family protein [Aquimarina mytili]MBL0684263.1 alkaline phosphatase family protein [Aquimarina mytili]
MKIKKIVTTVFLCYIQLCFTQTSNETNASDFIIAFGSCNKVNEPQPFWEEILKNNPNVFIWGGDNIYADSDDMNVVSLGYKTQNNNEGYKKLKRSIPIMATWDDHDYGKNDVGAEWEKKNESQHLFLDFLGISDDSPRRLQEGVYTSKVFDIEKGNVKVIVLDTRYFRSPLKKSAIEGRRYEPYMNNEGTLLGEKQWKWLEKELESNYSDFVIIVSSIQFLSSEHGFETWGNFPHEVERLQQLLVSKAVRNVIILSGDRHISEFSMTKIKGLKYPLVDFTSSGLTHSHSNYKGESNRYRVGRVISTPSFGLLKFDLDTYTVNMQIRGKNGIVYQEFKRQYPKN